MSVRVWNTLTRRKEALEPLDPPRLRLFVCGPTVLGEYEVDRAAVNQGAQRDVQRAEREGQDDLRVGRDPVPPTLVSSVYGMSFDGIPELRWRFGYAFAIALMVAVAAMLYVLFKRRSWI